MSVPCATFSQMYSPKDKSAAQLKVSILT